MDRRAGGFQRFFAIASRTGLMFTVFTVKQLFQLDILRFQLLRTRGVSDVHASIIPVRGVRVPREYSGDDMYSQLSSSFHAL